jgi:hypothetical protein
MAGDTWEITWRSPIGSISAFGWHQKTLWFDDEIPILLVKSCLSCERTTFPYVPRNQKKGPA